MAFEKPWGWISWEMTGPHDGVDFPSNKEVLLKTVSVFPDWMGSFFF